MEGIYDSEQYIDPTSRLLALSIDSYISKKTLIEITFFKIRIKNVSKIINDLNSVNIRFWIKISTQSEIFWIIIPCPDKKIQFNEYNNDIKLIARIRISKDIDISPYIIISLMAEPIDTNSKNKEIEVAFTKVELGNVLIQNKAKWIPLNGGISNEAPLLDENQTLLYMLLNIIENVNFIINRYQEIMMNHI